MPVYIAVFPSCALKYIFMFYGNKIFFILLFNNLVNCCLPSSTKKKKKKNQNLILIALILFLHLGIKLITKDIFGIFLWAVITSCLPTVYVLLFISHKIWIFSWTTVHKVNRQHFPTSPVSQCSHNIKFWPIRCKQYCVALL